MLRQLLKTYTAHSGFPNPRSRSFCSTPKRSTGHPNAPLELDPSLRELLRDVDLSVLKHKTRHGSVDVDQSPVRRELEVFPNDPEVDYLTSEELDSQDEGDDKGHRKSPAALFGSQRIGAVVLPLELQTTITKLIAESDKPLLHTDAKRLFLDDSGEKPQWSTSYETHYKSRHQAARHADRDGTAFASVALPSHYSATCAVFDHLKRRMDPDWVIERIIDWGSGTGSGLWASLHSFQKTLDLADKVDEPTIANSTIISYLGIDKRDGLVSIGKRLLKGTGVELGSLSATWHKSFQDDDKIRRTDGKNVIALSAFMLSSLPTPLSRKALVKEMWESGAEMMILIDHNTTAGYENIAGAREMLLRMGRKELEDPEAADWEVRGSHVIAPCPHDGACPLYHPGATKLVCGFTQRFQTPHFIRKTKHSGIGHEDIGYSYVVVRRGPRPTRVDTQVGRVGGVGMRELTKLSSAQGPVSELLVDGENHPLIISGELVEDNQPTSDAEESGKDTIVEQRSLSGDELDIALRSEAYNWPRLVFPPLKRSGHIILDGCTQEGRIMRMTIPKSQGKQPFYDARKSSWGDLFPHEPKNPPQERYQPQRAKRPGGTTPTKGSDIGKRDSAHAHGVKSSYGQLSEDVKEQKKRIRKERARARGKWFE